MNIMTVLWIQELIVTWQPRSFQSLPSSIKVIIQDYGQEDNSHSHLSIQCSCEHMNAIAVSAYGQG